MTSRWLWMGVAAALTAGVAFAQGGGTTALPGAPAAPAPRSTVRITFQTVPPEPKVKVRVGKKVLGYIRGARKPLIIERPRDSGPLDVTVQAEGFLPVHTRAHSFSDNRVSVKLTPIDQKHTVLGYKEELPPEDDADAGAPVGPPVGPPLMPAAGPDGGAPLPPSAPGPVPVPAGPMP